MSLSLQQFLGRFIIYVILTVGAVAMAFPFYWMLATSFKNKQEAGSVVPVWIPQQMQPKNWLSAASLGRQGNPGLDGVLIGGLEPGKSLAFEVVFKDQPESEEISAIIPKPRGIINFPLGDQVQTSTRFVGTSEEGRLFEVILEHTGEDKFRQIPLEILFSKEAAFVKSELAPDSLRSSRRNNKILFDNITAGGLGYFFKNYVQAWQAAPFGRYFFNSAFAAIIQVFAGLLVASMAAFALARIPFWGRGVVFMLIIGTLMVPGEVLLIPNYVLLARLDWINTYYALIVPFIASAFGIFLLRQFFITLPQELFDAARMDGASWFVQLWQIAVPLALPGLLTYALFAFLGAWNALLWPLIVTNSESMRTIQVGLMFFVEEAGTEYGQMMAASTVAILPIIIGFFFVQKQFIQGIARSGLK